MKKLFIAILTFISITATSQQLRPGDQVSGTAKASATVNQEHGLYVFVDSRPANEYKLIGSLSSKRVIQDTKSFQMYDISYIQLKDEIFRQLEQKKNKEKFSGAEAIIIYPDQQKADVIKFK